MFVGRSACPEPRREPAFALRPGHPSQRKNPLSRLFPLDSVHSPVSPLFPLHTRNIGGGASPEIRGTRPQPITNTIVTQQVSNVRRQFKYYLNCRHADNFGVRRLGAAFAMHKTATQTSDWQPGLAGQKRQRAAALQKRWHKGQRFTAQTASEGRP